MMSRPLPLLPFDHVGAEQLEWDGATDEITFAAPAGQEFRCAHDALHRIEVFIEPTFHFKRSHLWLLVCAGAADAPAADAPPAPLRVAGPLDAASLVAHGWFAFEFEPIAASAGKTFTFHLHAPDAAPGNALSVRAASAPTRRGGSRFVGGRQRDGALTFRASCLRAPALHANFQRFRQRSRQPLGTIDYQPLLVRLEISRPCNLHCVMCQRGLHPFDAKREAPGFMALETFRALDPILPTLLRVIAFGLGEPFLNPQYLEILRHARAQNPFAHVFTSTNGTRLSDPAIEAILDENLLSELQISLDGAERETFERIRRQASFDVVVGAFERVTAARARRRTRTLNVTGAMLVMKPNFTQIVAFAERMAALGVDRISLDSPKDAAFKPLRADSNDEMARIMEQVARVAASLAPSGVELSGPLLSELLIWHRTSGQPGSPPRFGADECAQLARTPGCRIPACGVPWESFSLAADGTVNVCCNSIRRMGHVREAAVGGTWESGAPYGRLRDELRTRALHTDCRTCLGENFVMPGETTPAIYLAGCLADTGQSASLAQHLGRRSDASEDTGPLVDDLRVGIDTAEWRIGARSGSPWRISGWLQPAGDGPTPLAPIPNATRTLTLTLAIAVEGVVRAYTATTATAHGRTQWSAVVADLPRPASSGAIEVFLVDGSALRRIAPVTAHLEPPMHAATEGALHGFVDEVQRTDTTVHFIGWARDATRRTPAARVLALIQGEPARSLSPWLPRADVARAFGDAATNFGYSLELPLELLAHARPRSIRILAVDDHGAALPLEWSDAACTAVELLLAQENDLRRRASHLAALERLHVPAPQNSSVCCNASRFRGSSVLNASNCIIESPAT